MSDLSLPSAATAGSLILPAAPLTRSTSLLSAAESDVALPSNITPDLARVVSLLRSDRQLWRGFTHLEWLHPREARYAPMPQGLHPELVEALGRRGITQLYSHQTRAVETAMSGKNVVVVTPTASGKTLCYALPVLHTLLGNPQARTVCLFPTKALSHDQLGTMQSLARELGKPIGIHSYDGDTPATARRSVRQSGHVVISNPDMLHAAILPHHQLWLQLFENLKYVVLDELHTYRGVFGSNLANVLRRFRRIAAFYGAKPTFICLSATLANPKELAEELIGDPVELVNENGAPSAEKAFFFYNPPVVNKELGIRRSVIKEARAVAKRFIGAGLPTIVFAKTRSRVELLTTYLRRDLEALGMDPNLVRGYRGGYLPQERREIERDLREGRILGVVSTNALEMGIDIGRLRVCIMAGYPGSIASTWQQSGRAGRQDAPSAVVLLASSEPVDQFIIQHPAYFFGASPELGLVNPDNVSILSSHVQCAAFELPFQDDERFGKQTNPKPILEFLERERHVRHTGKRWYWSSDVYPAENVSLRRADPENFLVQDLTKNNLVIAEVDYLSAPVFIHQHAIYIHDGAPYHVDQLDWEKRIAFVRPVKTDYYTDAVSKTTIQVLTTDQQVTWAVPSPKRVSTKEELAKLSGVDALPPAPWPFAGKKLGDVAVQTVVAKFKKVQFETHESLGYGDVHTPPMEMQTEAYWLTLNEDFSDTFKRAGLDPSGALTALAQAMANVIPAIALCDARDIQGVAMMRAPHDSCPALYLYDRFPGGVGLARRLFSRDLVSLSAARDLVETCACENGCPSCVGPILDVGPFGKVGARWLLERLVHVAREATPTILNGVA